MIASTDLGERLWELREARGWSQKRTAKEAGISHVTVAHLESGKVEPRLPTLRKLARTFDTTVEELMSEGGSASPLALELADMYVASDDARLGALQAANDEERERYAASIERVITDVLASTQAEGDWAEIATDETKPEGERREAREQLARIWAHINRLAMLRAEATGNPDELSQDELSGFIAAHASVDAA